jgi:hypothetical protein
MGTYTEIYVTGHVAPTGLAADVIRYLFGQGAGNPPDDLPDHPLFRSDRWECIGAGASAYFSNPVSAVTEGYGRLEFTSTSNFKNYGGEIALFFDWLGKTGATFVGYERHEESQDTLKIYLSPDLQEG